MIIDFIIEDLMLNSYLQKNFHTLDEELVRMNDYCLLSDFVVTENYIMTCIGINAQCNAK